MLMRFEFVSVRIFFDYTLKKKLKKMRNTKVRPLLQQFTKNKMISCLLLFVISGCAVEDSISSAQVLYEMGSHDKKEGNCLTAVRSFEELDAKYPFSAYKDQVQFDLMYCYYHLNQMEKSSLISERFIRMNPTHPNVDYAYFLKGVASSATLHNGWMSSLGQNRAHREIELAQQAFQDFERLTTKYPDSHYAADARLRMQNLREFLATHHLSVAKQYFVRHAYVAASRRGQYIVHTLNGTSAVQPALELMYQSYGQLEKPKLQENVALVYQATYGKPIPRKAK
jgi:outer membrane protein assembly factor BamD